MRTTPLEIIVRDEQSSLKMKMPPVVANRLIEIAKQGNTVEEGDNEAILRMIVKSLDNLIFGFENLKDHNISITTDLGGSCP